ncbi:MAG TPA: UvrD-helicase domain-containing protein [Gemmatimonadaceae bacterium]|nr:UvrD-helicase domain-containing protein [Gemmatimonadaceae bacterium]
MTAPVAPSIELLTHRSASRAQRDAIEAPAGPLLVLAGPGAGKTYCLIERIRFLIEELQCDPARICAFTFTNKAAGEIAHRLGHRLGPAASRITRGTIHAFCAELLRELGPLIGIERGFGIADEDYQLSVLRRIEGPRRWHRYTLNRFSAYRFRGQPLLHDDSRLFAQYERFLAARKVLDFDTLVLSAATLLETAGENARVHERWDAILVDEFQDLNPVQYRVVHALAKHHQHVFAVGDHEQSIYSWAGADLSVFTSFVNDFHLSRKIHLDQNHRCPREAFELARKLVRINPALFDDHVPPTAERESPFPVGVMTFDTDDEEASWIVDDIRRDRAEHAIGWGDVALLYRTHEIGHVLEAALINGNVPCRLAQGRALADDPVVAYVIAALRVIAEPTDDVHRDAFFGVVLPRPLFDEARAQAEAARQTLGRHLKYMASRLPRSHENARQIRRALADWRNLAALGKNHTTLGSLVQDLLSRRVGKVRSVLDDRHDEISDPTSLDDVVSLAARLSAARRDRTTVWMPRMNGAEIGLKAILGGIGINDVALGGLPPRGSLTLVAADVGSVGLALGVFKAAQLIEMSDVSAVFDNFTAVDLETTDNDTEKAEIVEIAAVRVRNGEIVAEFNTLVKPKVAISPGASATHGIHQSDVATASPFADIWPKFQAFCGSDVIVAHNGYEFDFKILQRMAKELGKRFDLCTYDTLPLARDLYPTSRKLGDLARQFGVPLEKAHRALDDSVALAKVTLRLDDAKRAHARKTALVSQLDQLGVALALCDDASLCDEARMFRAITRGFALSRYSSCLENYEREQGDDLSIPTVDELIERLGGAELMLKIRTDKTAEERYPAAMIRLRRLIAQLPAGSLDTELRAFLERAVLSKWDGHETERGRVNLLTLHSTKGLEFSRVYIVGVEDGQLPGGSPKTGPKPAEIEEARRLLYVGMTRTKDRLVLTRAVTRAGRPTRGTQFLDEMGLGTSPAAVAT